MAIRARAPTQQPTPIKLLLLSQASPGQRFGLVKVGVEKFSFTLPRCEADDCEIGLG